MGGRGRDADGLAGSEPVPLGAQGKVQALAAFHDEETARWTEMTVRLFGPILMLVIGLLIGIIVVLLYLPIFQLADSIQ